jgi:hypothetical protein
MTEDDDRDTGSARAAQRHFEEEHPPLLIEYGIRIYDPRSPYGSTVEYATGWGTWTQARAEKAAAERLERFPTHKVEVIRRAVVTSPWEALE